MGEVYRADDLKLGQPVALKFLPDALDARSRRASRSSTTRSASRAQVSHRNVCRIYDIGEADGRTFLTMEYVDGEDLASLLRRIGRLPQDKARRGRAADLRRRRRGARARRAAPRPQAGQRDDRRRAATCASPTSASPRVAGRRRQRPRRHAGVHGAGAARRPRGHARAATSTRSAWCSTSCSPASASFEAEHARRADRSCTESRHAGDRPRRSCAISIRRSSARSCAASSAIRRSAPRRRWRCRRRCPAAIRSPRRWRRARRRRRRWSRPPASRARCSRRSAWRWSRFTAGDARDPDARVAALRRHRIAFRCRSRPMRCAIARRRCSSGSAIATRRTTASHGWMFRRDYVDWAARRRRRGSAGALLPGGRTGTVNFWYRTSPVPIVSAIVNPLPTHDRSAVRVRRHAHGVPRSEWPAARVPGAVAAGRRWRRGARRRTGRRCSSSPGCRDRRSTRSTPLWLPRNQADARAAWEGPSPDMPGMTLRVEAAAIAASRCSSTSSRRGRAPTRRHGAGGGDRSAACVDTVANVIGVLIMSRRRFSRGGTCAAAAAIGAAPSAPRPIIFVSQACALLLRARHYAMFDVEIAGDRAARRRAVRADRSGCSTWRSSRTCAVLADAADRLDAAARRARSRSAGRPRHPDRRRGGHHRCAADGVSRVHPGDGRAQAGDRRRLPPASILLGSRYEIVAALDDAASRLQQRFEIVCIVVFLKIVVRRTWLVCCSASSMIIPIAMNGRSRANTSRSSSASSSAASALVFGVLLRFGLLAHHRRRSTRSWRWKPLPLTTDCLGRMPALGYC